jgi:putative transcriptional regulator
MITPRRHPHGETLMSYAAGALDPAFTLVLCCHLQFCAICRRRARALDEVGGVLLERMAIEEDEAFSARTMGRFSAEHAQELGARSHSSLEAGDEVVMPGPLARATGLNRATIPWKDEPYGERRYDLPKLRGAAASARIVHIEPGAVLHSEKHGGQLVLVLWGACIYDGERLERGDLHDIGSSGFQTFASASPEGATFVTAVAPAHQTAIMRTAH